MFAKTVLKIQKTLLMIFMYIQQFDGHFMIIYVDNYVMVVDDYFVIIE